MRLNETILVFLDSVDADSPNHMEKQTNWFYLRTRRNTNHSSFDIFFKERSSDSSISQMQLGKRIAIEKSREFSGRNGSSSVDTRQKQWVCHKCIYTCWISITPVDIRSFPSNQPIILKKNTLFTCTCVNQGA